MRTILLSLDTKPHSAKKVSSEAKNIADEGFEPVQSGVVSEIAHHFATPALRMIASWNTKRAEEGTVKIPHKIGSVISPTTGYIRRF